MAAKDVSAGADKAKLVYEVADLWFHSLVALAHYGLRPEDVIGELMRREGTSGIEEKAQRKAGWFDGCFACDCSGCCCDCDGCCECDGCCCDGCCDCCDCS